MENGKAYDRKTKVIGINQDVIVTAVGRTGYEIGTVEFDAYDVASEALSKNAHEMLQPRLQAVELALKTRFDKIEKAFGSQAKHLEIDDESNFAVVVMYRTNSGIGATEFRLKYIFRKPVTITTRTIAAKEFISGYNCFGGACDLVEALIKGSFREHVTASTAKLLDVKVPTEAISLREVVAGSRQLISLGSVIGKRVSNNVNISNEADCLIFPHSGVVHRPLL